MRVGITGATGLIGSALISQLRGEGHHIFPIRRSGLPAGDAVVWDPSSGELAGGPLSEGLDAVVHLAGENVAAGRWTPALRNRIYDSRGPATSRLCGHLAEMAHPPTVLVSASAVGYYGSQGNTLLTEESSPGTDFLAGVCRAWEEGTRAASDAGIRVAHLRTGIVLSASGGPLAKMLPMFRLGLGGPLGDGNQWMSWIALDDLTAAIQLILERSDLHGAVNLVAPNPVRNREFAEAVGRAVGRPARLATPAFALRMALGREMADSLLLASQRVLPTRLLHSGFRFRRPELDEALRAALELLHR